MEVIAKPGAENAVKIPSSHGLDSRRDHFKVARWLCNVTQRDVLKERSGPGLPSTFAAGEEKRPYTSNERQNGAVDMGIPRSLDHIPLLTTLRLKTSAKHLPAHHVVAKHSALRFGRREKKQHTDDVYLQR
ncbi:hypothetical protein LTR91_022319 [Friedmanniomyces endolithicus]|uniref:Uncharacterized protein n=1 Tax=Friedmanniomyces endolithicus TaxID=329885 RepID=A0AAN6JZC7_9PEZI|nr:hypothetical protein LTS09_017730 [Friedmanniomyces endolithicus]KAK0332965.1 hypothetical protein LTR94_022854 [Friedmanniomyces endolithicus]KAK0768293.1 hypothetical protein LTR59_017770 [Friedmanniomyces endolithicus]KAK0769929.1 hypothetical protein LTR38_017739 [Friedmanniomyces endolithicus]KAK0827591.1 hypothetical protein LTR03_016827 [Friedmanniomyces endolithicus]